ncbi:hypothetical protein FHS59_004166 [Algoriphagus iocasae]|uniref:Uncharacterized protein n=1 Tax=Algoriphagus iocasae TaxID=1836499 RepID=A0A841MM19_9BACT|nr:hypothetical protein [Algoriphagus iocasae]MBB6328510.1 hypothetical protein [Algoriphagus iocasae]
MKTNKTKDPQNSKNKTTEELAKEAKVTKEDLQALGPKDANLSHDGGEDEQLIERKRKVDFSGDGLDVPGSELDDEQERIGSEDEENNLYSNADEEKK